MEFEKQEILVIGAGMSGLSATLALAESGMRVTVIEARNRVGGRILSKRHGAEVVELGAQFVHGRTPELWELIHEAGLETYELQGSHLSWRGGRHSAEEDDAEEGFKWIEALKNRKGPDCSFKDYLKAEHVQEPGRTRLIRYVEGFNAADYRMISVASLGKQQEAEDAIEGDRLFQVRGGYNLLSDYLAQEVRDLGGTILLDTQVTSVFWRPGRVQITCLRGETLVTRMAAQAIITLPLGILKSGQVRFDPEPTTVIDAAKGLRMGSVERTVMLFRECFWRELDQAKDLKQLKNLGVLYAFAMNLPVWWTQHPDLAPMLTAWAGGALAEAQAMDRLGERGDRLLMDLAQIFAIDLETLRGLLVKVIAHDWTADPFSMGAYSYVSVVAVDASAILAQPISDTLYFAGEHTDTTGHWGRRQRNRDPSERTDPWRPKSFNDLSRRGKAVATSA